MSLGLPPAQMAFFSVLIEASSLLCFRPPESMTAFVIVAMAVTNGQKLEVPASIIATNSEQLIESSKKDLNKLCKKV